MKIAFTVADTTPLQIQEPVDHVTYIVEIDNSKIPLQVLMALKPKPGDMPMHVSITRVYEPREDK